MQTKQGQSIPITFVEPSYCLLDQISNCVLTTQYGGLAIFSTQGVAEQAASQVRRKFPAVKVIPVSIAPKLATELNPQSMLLEQLREHWQKIAALLVWKLAPAGVTLTHKEIEAFPQDQVLLTHGHKDSVDLKLVSKEVAEMIVAHDAAQTGHA